MSSPPFVPIPVMGPFAHYQQPQATDDGDPPARVRAALEFLANLGGKTATRAAANDMAIELIPGQELSAGERHAQEAACEMLAAYFAGRLRPNYWERRPPRRGRPGGDGDGALISCPVCRDGASSRCRLCRGTGMLMTYPTSEEG